MDLDYTCGCEQARKKFDQFELICTRFKESSVATPVCNAACAQQQLSIAPPLSLKYDIDVQLFVVDEDMLHASMEAVQLGFTLPYCVIGLWTT